MAEDPRKVAAALVLRYAVLGLVSGVELPDVIDDVFDAADAADPLRALLADEDRAREVIAECIAGPGIWEHLPDGSKYLIRQNGAARVLAALREVAGP